MMNDFEIRSIREIFARLFVIGVQNKINFKSFLRMLEKSKYLNLIEKNGYDDYLNKPIEILFYDITGYQIDKDTSYGIYNDAYWCGQNYFDLFLTLKKSFSYIFLKLPLDTMMNIYPIYHEMDFSSLVVYFKEIEQKETIIRILCNNNHCSLNDVSKATNINLGSLIKYNMSDELLRKASFQNINKLIDYFDVRNSLFVE